MARLFGSEAQILGVLDKIESWSEHVALESTEQTKILTSIDTKLDKKLSEGSNQKIQLDQKSAKAFSIVISSLESLLISIDKVDEVKVEKVLSAVARGVDKINELIDPKRIKDFAKGLAMVGLSVIAFGISMVVAAPLYVAALPGIILAGLVISGMSALFSLLPVKQIKEGAIGISIMALGLFGLGYALEDFGKRVTLESIGMASIAVSGLGLVMGLLGKFSLEIIKGSFAIGLATIPLFLIGMAMDNFKSADVQLEDIGIMGAAVGGLGVAMGLAGLGAPFILAGSAAMIVAGASLMVMSKGLEMFKDINFDEEDSKNLNFALGAIRGAFIGTEGNSNSLLDKLGGAIGGVIDSGKMLASAAGYSAAGVALILLSKGLESFKEVDFNEEESIKLNVALKSVAGAFAVAGGQEFDKQGDGLLGLIGIQPNAVEVGIKSVLKSGEALTEIARGLKVFKNLEGFGISSEDFMMGSDGKPSEGTLLWNVSSVVGVLGEVFANIGKGDSADERSIFGKMFFADQTDTERGVQSVLDLGQVLIDIADGVKKWNDLTSMGIDMNKVSQNIKSVVTVVGDTFASIGGSQFEEEDSILGGLISWDENTVAKGIDAVKGVGEELLGIADGVKIFADLNKMQLGDDPWNINNKGSLASNIRNIVTMVGDIFATIGNNEEEDSALWGLISWDENAVAKGIDAVSGAGEELKNIAMGMKTFSEIENPEDLSKSIVNMLNGALGVFDVAQDPQIEKKLEGFEWFSKSFLSLTKNAKKSKILSENFAKISSDMGVFKDNMNALDLEKLTIIDNLFKNLRELGKIDKGLESISIELGESLDKGFNNLSAILKEIAGVNTEGFGNLQPSTGSNNSNETQNIIAQSDPRMLRELTDSMERIRVTLLSGIPVSPTDEFSG